MAGLEFFSDFNGQIAELALENLSRLDKAELLESLSGLGVSQTQRRIAEEKSSPDGTGWPSWHPSTAARRHSGQSLLFAEGNLADSIYAAPPTGNEVAWGSNLVYAAVHNFGYAEGGIPQRQYLGISADNAREMEQAALQFISGALQ